MGSLTSYTVQDESTSDLSTVVPDNCRWLAMRPARTVPALDDMLPWEQKKVVEGNILATAIERFSQIDFRRLAAHGFTRDPWEYEFIVTYPPLPVLGQGKPDFLNRRVKRRRIISIYVHIPYCTSTCAFCGRYVKYGGRRDSDKIRYLTYLRKEIKLWQSILELEHYEVASLYFGGGTPTVLPPAVLHDVITDVRGSFACTENTEITVETSPETATREILCALSAAGVTRLSIGAQSFDDGVLKLCRRRHNASHIWQAIHSAREVGLRNVNIDLISGLPTYDLNKLLTDLRCIIELQPDGVTSYPLYIQPSSAMHKMDRLEFPNPNNLALMRLVEQLYMAELGYQESPIHFYFRYPSHRLRQWEHKWQDEGELIGLGVSSYGFYNRTQYHNHMRQSSYYSDLDCGRLPVWRLSTLNADEEYRRRLIFQLKSGVISRHTLCQPFSQTIEQLLELGLLQDHKHMLLPTDVGKLFSEEMCLQFFSNRVRALLKGFGRRYGGYMNMPGLYYSPQKARVLGICARGLCDPPPTVT